MVSCAGLCVYVHLSGGLPPRHAKGLKRKEGQQGMCTAFFTAKAASIITFSLPCTMYQSRRQPLTVCLPYRSLSSGTAAHDTGNVCSECRCHGRVLHVRQYPGARGGPSTQRGQRSTCRPARRRPAALQRPLCEWAVCPCSLHALHRQHIFQESAIQNRCPCNACGLSKSAVSSH